MSTLEDNNGNLIEFRPSWVSSGDDWPDFVDSLQVALRQIVGQAEVLQDALYAEFSGDAEPHRNRFVGAADAIRSLARDVHSYVDICWESKRRSRKNSERGLFETMAKTAAGMRSDYKRNLYDNVLVALREYGDENWEPAREALRTAIGAIEAAESAKLRTGQFTQELNGLLGRFHGGDQAEQQEAPA